jgi:hypothetical protein
MITVTEIQKKSKRKYEEVLRFSLNGESCFPLEIRSNKTLSKDFIQMSKEIAEVLGGSKDRKGFGYSVVSETIKTRQHGVQDIPKSIQFDTLDDYLKFLKKDREFNIMMENYRLIRSGLGQIESWLKKNPMAIINNSNKWPGLIKVCKWFLNDFEPDKYYLRELPISVHTKFIEENKPILKTLIDELAPDIVVPSENSFEKRYNLKYDQPVVRFRFLDRDYLHTNKYDDLTVPIEQFAKISIDCKRVFIVENKMNFLTFPQMPLSIAIWGKGFAIEILKAVEWLHDKELYCWSDIDVQGFQMLSQLRSYFKQTKAFLMGKSMIEKYEDYIVTGTLPKSESISHLSIQELEVYEFLLNNNFRLEQERIPNHEIHKGVRRLFR